ncbi:MULTISPECIES: GNAT family N-acetyltransferase [unclassified Enterococcus]|uniref:GNAT family N-acetyltransferase n=1 Tax=unclassified Enterococcus TaxID=2608891 RepID=UPI001A9B30BA|nr:GNAT family N-acetyltransferase [Enterococcus sp. DIV1271a]MBO1298716.1 GNAT family N-acetyltransferase [Enterococcus sp. DIV1271a]
MRIYLVEEVVEKKKIVQEILADLPEWFGLPDSTQEYVENCQNYPLWALQENNESIGFISLKETSKATGEVYCMGVKKAYHHQGIGKRLLQELQSYASEHYKFLQVKTVAEGTYGTYDQTIRFYRTMGFVELEVFPTLWDEWNPCLVMIKSLN